jgi:excisionase family DNA binding protein
MDDKPGVSDEPEFLTVKQAARHLNISPGCIYRLCSTGKLPHYKFGDGQGAVRIARGDLLEFVRGCRVEKRDGRTGNGSVRGRRADLFSSTWSCDPNTPAEAGPEREHLVRE